MNLRLFARTFALVVCASAVIASAAVGGTKHEPACRPSWFLLSFSYTFHARSIGISGNFNYVGHLGAVCHIPGNRPYYVQLSALGRDGQNLVVPSSSSFAGDVPAGSGSGASITVPLHLWCRKQPVELKLLGPAPVWPPPPSRKLVLRGIKGGC